MNNTPALVGHITIDKQSAAAGETVTITSDGTYNDDQISWSHTGGIDFTYSLHTWTFTMVSENVTISNEIFYYFNLDGAYANNFSFTNDFQDPVRSSKIYVGGEITVYPENPSSSSSYNMVTNTGTEFTWDGYSYWTGIMPELFGTSYTYMAITPTPN